MYRYRIFDLAVCSEVFLPEADPSTESGGPDISVVYGSMPFDLLEHPRTKNPGGLWHYCFPGDGRMLFRAGGIGFEVSGGSRIVIDPHGAGHEKEGLLRTLLLGTAFGALHMQRGNVPIHGAAIRGNGGITIISGTSGSGKSAVLGALAGKGLRYLADDVAAVTLENGFPEVLPAYPQRKIAREDAEAFGYDVAGLVQFSEDGREKYAVRSRGEWASRRGRLVAVAELAPVRRRDGGEVVPSCSVITGGDALRLVTRSLYRREFYAAAGAEPALLKKVLAIAAGIRAYRMLRPALGMPPAETARMIRESCGL